MEKLSAWMAWLGFVAARRGLARRGMVGRDSGKAWRGLVRFGVAAQWRSKARRGMAQIDIIIPTIQGREASLTRCVESFKAHAADVNIIQVLDSRTCSWGWKQGLAASRAPYVLFACDDLECVSPTWGEVCIETVDAGKLPCPRVYRPDGSIESNGGDMNSLHHLIARPQKDMTPCDYTVLPFLSREMAQEIVPGMGDWQYCGDVWASYRGRQLGYETVLRHGYDLIHHQEQVGRGAGMSQNDRDAMDAGAMFAELDRLAKPHRALPSLAMPRLVTTKGD